VTLHVKNIMYTSLPKIWLLKTHSSYINFVHMSSVLFLSYFIQIKDSLCFGFDNLGMNERKECMPH
jgi:hypothetical protein